MIKHQGDAPPQDVAAAVLLPIEWEPKEGSSELFKKHNKSRRPPNKHKDHPGHRRAAAYQKKRVWLTDRPRCCVCWCCCSWVGAVVVNCSAADDSAYASWWIYSRFGINKKKSFVIKTNSESRLAAVPRVAVCIQWNTSLWRTREDPRRSQLRKARCCLHVPAWSWGKYEALKWCVQVISVDCWKKKKVFTITRQLLTFFSAEKISRIMKMCLWGPWMSKYMY